MPSRRISRAPKLPKPYYLDPRSLDRPTRRGQDLPIGADEVRFVRSAKGILGVVDLHRNTNVLHREELSSGVEGEPRERQAKCSIAVGCPGTVRSTDEHLV